MCIFIKIGKKRQSYGQLTNYLLTHCAADPLCRLTITHYFVSSFLRGQHIPKSAKSDFIWPRKTDLNLSQTTDKWANKQTSPRQIDVYYSPHRNEISTWTKRRRRKRRKIRIPRSGEQHLTIEVLMAKAVCKMGQEVCMSGECTKCLKEKGVQDFLKTLDSVEAAESFTYM